MIEQRVTVRNPSGLHARPAATFVSAAKKFADTRIWILKGDTARDAKSILQVLQAEVTAGTLITIRAEGAAEAEAVRSLVELIDGGLGEA